MQLWYKTTYENNMNICMLSTFQEASNYIEEIITHLVNVILNHGVSSI